VVFFVAGRPGFRGPRGSGGRRFSIPSTGFPDSRPHNWWARRLRGDRRKDTIGDLLSRAVPGLVPETYKLPASDWHGLRTFEGINIMPWPNGSQWLSLSSLVDDHHCHRPQFLYRSDRFPAGLPPKQIIANQNQVPRRPAVFPFHVSTDRRFPSAGAIAGRAPGSPARGSGLPGKCSDVFPVGLLWDAHVER